MVQVIVKVIVEMYKMEIWNIKILICIYDFW